MEEKIKFTVEETGEEVEFFVVEQTRINNMDYLLVTEEQDDEEAEAYILKDISKTEDEDAIYELVENDSELEYVSAIFAEILDDIDLQR
jgi:hypothetical protein